MFRYILDLLSARVGFHIIVINKNTKKPADILYRWEDYDQELIIIIQTRTNTHYGKLEAKQDSFSDLIPIIDLIINGIVSYNS